jgi:hypothetical protein
MQRAMITVRSLVLGMALAAGVAAASCSGDSEEKPPTPTTDAGELQLISCGSDTCEGVEIPIKGYAPLEPCCAEGNACGLDSTFLASFGISFSEACQAKNQPGVLGQGCPDSAAPMIPGLAVEIPPFAGCCRLDTHTCGYQLDKLLSLITVDLGCVDSAPFLDGGMPAECDPEGPDGTAGAGP